MLESDIIAVVAVTLFCGIVLVFFVLLTN